MYPVPVPSNYFFSSHFSSVTEGILRSIMYFAIIAWLRSLETNAIIIMFLWSAWIPLWMLFGCCRRSLATGWSSFKPASNVFSLVPTTFIIMAVTFCSQQQEERERKLNSAALTSLCKVHHPFLCVQAFKFQISFPPTFLSIVFHFSSQNILRMLIYLPLPNA